MKILKKLIVLTIVLIGFTANALTVTDGAIVGKMVVNKRPTVVNELITVNYVFLYKSNRNSNIQIKLEYPKEYLSARFVVSLPGKPNPACKFTTSDVITCYNVEHSKEQLMEDERKAIASSLLEATVMYNLKGSKVEDNKIPKIITDYDKVKFSTSKSEITIPKIKAKDGSFIKVAEKHEVAVEENQSLNYEVTKEYKDKKLTFTSSDPSIVTVDKDGILTGVKEGTAKVTIATEDDQKTVEVKVTPKAKEECTVNKVTVTKPSKFIRVGEVFSLDVKPDNTCFDKRNLKYENSDSSVVWVDTNGYLVGLKSGKAHVKIMYNGKELANLDVQVGLEKKKSNNSLLIIIVLIVIVIVVVLYFFLGKKKKYYPSYDSSDDKDDYSSSNTNNNKTKETDNEEEYFDGIDLDV